MRRFFAILGFGGFGLTAVIHALTFFGVDPMSRWPGLWIFHLVAMVALVSALFRFRGMRRPDLAREPYRALFGTRDMDEAMALGDRVATGTERDREHAEREYARRLRPHPLYLGLLGLAAYAFVNFAVSLALLDGGVPERRGDSFQLTAHGKVLRELSSSEYGWHRAYQTRLATGHWMFFLFAAGVFWTLPRRAVS